MAHINLLSRNGGLGSPAPFTQTHLELDATFQRFTEEAANPAALASMTLAGLAFHAGRSGLLGLALSKNACLTQAFSYASALAGEVSVFRAARHFLQGSASPVDAPFNAQGWMGTALDLGLLKFAGAAAQGQSLFLRHAAQDLAMVTGHRLAAQAGWAPEVAGGWMQQLIHAEATNWALKAGGALAHTLTGGRFQALEQRLALQASANVSLRPLIPAASERFEPAWTQTPRMASTEEAPSSRSLRLYLRPRVDESPRQWAERLAEFTAQSPEENALPVLERLMDGLFTAASREHALSALEHLAELTQRIPEGENILVRRYPVEGLQEPILLVSLPSTFLPEAWSRTFVEGMARDQAAQPRERELAIEVGSGTGFVSIAAAKLGLARRILATDRNPHAPLVGRLNAAINGVDNIEFQVGDLLAGIPEGTPADLIFGCLPQMPSEQPAGRIGLRGLADYAEERGVFEDQLGLGLNATLIEQAKSRLSPDGRLRLMMAQRPGLAALHDLFATRGFAPRILHSRFIQQDPGTHFEALAHIEERRGFSFDFRTRDGAPLRASEALALDRNEIFHFLHLVEAAPYSSLMHRAVEGLGAESPRWGYSEDAGRESPALRSQLHRHLEGLWGLLIDPETLFIAPSHASLLEGALRLTLKSGELVGVAGFLDPLSERALQSLGEWPTLRLPDTPAELAARLDEAEAPSPRLLILRLPRQVLQNPSALERVFAASIRRNMPMVFLEEQGSLLDSQGKALLRALARYPQALARSVIVHPLGDAFGLPAFPLAAALVPHAPFRRLLAQHGDVSYSRASSAIQAAYERFFALDEMQNPFQAPPVSSEKVESTQRAWENFPSLGLAVQLGRSPAFTSSPRDGRAPLRAASAAAEGIPADAPHPGPVIDMSFGESEWAARVDWAPILRKAMRETPRALHVAATQAVLRYLQHSRQASFIEAELSLGAGVQPLIGAALRGIQRLHPGAELEVVVPQPSYGIFPPTVLAAGARLSLVPTASAQRFLLRPQDLEAFPKKPGTVRAVLLNTPNNPAGQFYLRGHLAALAQAAPAQWDYLLMDEVFGALAYEGSYLWSAAAQRDFEGPMGRRLVTFGGLSKEFAQGGLRFGFAASANTDLIRAMNERNLLPADPIALATASSLLPAWRQLISEHLRYLEVRIFLLEHFFRRKGYDLHRVEGGYTLFVDLNPLFETPHSIGGQGLRAENFHDLLLQHAGIRIKSDAWAGVPGHYRFAFSIDRLEEAVGRLEGFWERLERP